MLAFNLILLLSLFLAVFYFSYRKASEHVELLKATDSRFYDIDEVVDLLQKSQKSIYFYFMFLYVHSPFYYTTGKDRFQHIEVKLKKNARALWLSLGMIGLLFLVDYLRSLLA